MLAVKSGRVIGAVDTLTGHVITGARSSVTLTRQTTPASVLPVADIFSSDRHFFAMAVNNYELVITTPELISKELAWGFSDLEVTWLPYCAGAATGCETEKTVIDELQQHIFCTNWTSQIFKHTLHYRIVRNVNILRKRCLAFHRIRHRRRHSGVQRVRVNSWNTAYHRRCLRTHWSHRERCFPDSDMADSQLCDSNSTHIALLRWGVKHSYQLSSVLKNPLLLMFLLDHREHWHSFFVCFADR